MKSLIKALASMLKKKEIKNAAILELLDFESFAKSQNPENKFSKLKDIPDYIPNDMRVFYSHSNPVNVRIMCKNEVITFYALTAAKELTDYYANELSAILNTKNDLTKFFVFATYSETGESFPLFSYFGNIFIYKDDKIIRLESDFNTFLYDIIE